MQSLVKVKKRNRYTAVKSATAIQRSKARPLYSGLSPDEASFFTALPCGEGTPPVRGGPSPGEPGFVWRGDLLPLRTRNGRRSSRRTGLTGGGPLAGRSQVRLARAPPNGWGSPRRTANPRACFFVDASLSLTARLTPGKNFRGLDCVTVDNDTPDLL